MLDNAGPEFEAICEALATSDWTTLFAALGDQPDFANRSNELTGIPWFHVAIELGAPDVISWMIENGADLNHFDAQGFAPLSYVAFREDNVAEITELLVRSGADIHAYDAIGNTALHVAAASGSGIAVRALLTAGANPLAFNSDTVPATPVDLAENAGHSSIVEMLKSAGRSATDAHDKGL